MHKGGAQAMVIPCIKIGQILADLKTNGHQMTIGWSKFERFCSEIGQNLGHISR
jgi:hypothetical protein